MIPDDLIILHMQSVHRKASAPLDAGLAADASGRIILRHGHTDDPEIVHPDFGAVVGTARESHLEMKIIGKNLFFNSFCKF